MKTVEELAQEAGFQPVLWDGSGTLVYEAGPLHLSRFRDLVLEEAAKACDTTPPHPFRPSIEAAHAIRAIKGQK